MRATIRDVARKASRPASAVPRVLNGRIELPDSTRRRIENAADPFNRRPNAVAALATGTPRVAGVAIPRQLSIIGFDGSLVVPDPPPTTNRPRPDASGRRGVRMLLDLIPGEAVDVVSRRVPVELAVRGSLGRPAARCAGRAAS